MTRQTAFASGRLTLKDQFPIQRYVEPVEAQFKASATPSTHLEELRELVNSLYTATGQAFSVIEEFGDQKDSILCTLNDNPHVQFLVEAMLDHIETQTVGANPITSKLHKGSDAINEAMDDFAHWVGRTCEGHDQDIRFALNGTSKRDIEPDQTQDGANVIHVTFG